MSDETPIIDIPVRHGGIVPLPLKGGRFRVEHGVRRDDMVRMVIEVTQIYPGGTTYVAPLHNFVSDLDEEYIYGWTEHANQEAIALGVHWVVGKSVPL